MNIAILGAECTGKTSLSQALVAALQAPNRSVLLVPEVLRQWCEIRGRTPFPHEQLSIARAQAELVIAPRARSGPVNGRASSDKITQKADHAEIVISDTSALMTAIYSDVLFGDASLYPFSLEQQRLFDVTLVCGLDLPWEADGIQRDGPAVRKRVDQRLREVLSQHHIAYATVYGQGVERIAAALQPIHHKLGELHNDDTALARWNWTCEKCSDPDCEHRMFTRLTQAQNQT